jgi:hypothetical protein
MNLQLIENDLDYFNVPRLIRLLWLVNENNYIYLLVVSLVATPIVH